MATDTTTHDEVFAWANLVPTKEDSPYLYRLFGYKLIRDITCDGTMVNIHVSNAANHLETIL